LFCTAKNGQIAEAQASVPIKNFGPHALIKKTVRERLLVINQRHWLPSTTSSGAQCEPIGPNDLDDGRSMHSLSAQAAACHLCENCREETSSCQ